MAGARGTTKLIVGGEGAGDLSNSRRSRSRLGAGSGWHAVLHDAGQCLGRGRARTGASCGITSGKQRAARTSAIAALAMWNDYLFMETPDDYLVSLDAQTGKERWHKVIADLDQGYFSTPAPIVVGNHVSGGNGQRHRFAGFPAIVRSGDGRTAVEALHGSDGEGRSRVWTPGRVWMRRGTAARRRGSRARTIRKRSSIFSAPAIRRRPLQPARAARETTFLPAR